MTNLLKISTLVVSFAMIGCYGADMPTHDEYQDAPGLIEVPKMDTHTVTHSNTQSSQNPVSSQHEEQNSSYSDENEWPEIIELPHKIEIPKKK